MPSLVMTHKQSGSQGSLKKSLFRVSDPARTKLQSRNNVDGEPLVVTFPFGPQNIQHDTLGALITEVARPGKKPILVRENPSLRTVSFTAMIADKASGGAVSVISTLDQLETLAVGAIPCKFVYGLTTLTYTVVITKFSYVIKRRNQEGEPVQVEVSIQLTEFVDVEQEIQELVAVVRTVETTQSSDNYTKEKSTTTSTSKRTSVVSPDTPSGYFTPPVTDVGNPGFVGYIGNGIVRV